LAISYLKAHNKAIYDLKGGPVLLFYIGLGLQITGLCTVGFCFFKGISEGDYGKMELAQFISGILSFYMGHFLKGQGEQRD